MSDKYEQIALKIWGDPKYHHTDALVVANGFLNQQKEIKSLQSRLDEADKAYLALTDERNQLVLDKRLLVAQRNEAEASNKVLRGLLERAFCPDCGGSGFVPYLDSLDRPAQRQCRWCFEKGLTLTHKEEG